MLRRALAILAVLAAAFACVVWLSGGITFTVAEWRFSSRTADRPLIAAAVVLLLYWFAGGRRYARQDLAAVVQVVTPARVALALALITAIAGLFWNSWTAGGADSYAYASQARQWLEGDLKIAAPLADAVPWPSGIETLTPFGYRAGADGISLVPVTAPGLPLLMAAFAWLGGHCAGFWVPPLAGGLLVWTTFLIGRRMTSSGVGLGAAWLVATSPVFLSMFKSTMSDVPAAAFWALATSCLLTGTRRGAIAAGLAASTAILIRPNLVPVAAVLGLWSLARDLRTTPHDWRRSIGFAAATVPGCLVIAWLNDQLYGSPLTSGYGSLAGLFSAANILTNTQRYGQWLIETQTVLALPGMLAVLLPIRRLWSRNDARASAAMLGAIVIVVWLANCAYAPFDAWWFLRFMMPIWPALCIGMAAVVARVLDFGGAGRMVAALIIFTVGIYCAQLSVRLGVFPEGEGERRYATIAKAVEAATDDSAVIITGQHIGSVRYYAGRVTLRYDVLAADWLDRAADWLTRQDRHVYVLLEDWELPLFKERFAASNRIGRLDLAPALVYKADRIPGTVFLYDLDHPDGPTTRPPPVRDPRPRCVEPAAPVVLALASSASERR